MRYFFVVVIIVFNYVGYSQSPYYLAAAYNGDSWGFVNQSGKYKVFPQFRKVKNFSEGLAAVYNGDKWGFIDSSGNFIISPMFDFVGPFSCTVARVRIDGKWGYINHDGEIVLKGGYTDVTDFNEGYALVEVGEKRGIINLNGEYIIPLGDGFLKNFTCGRAIVKVSGDFGYIDTRNKLVIKNRFDRVDYFSDGLARVWGNEGLGFIDTSGRYVFTLDKEVLGNSFNVVYDIGYYKEGRVFVRGNFYNLFAVYDSVGKKVTSYKFLAYRPYSEGLAAVCLEKKKWGFIDKNGKIIIEPSYKNVRDFSCGVVEVEKDGLWGYMNKDGKWVIKPVFVDCSKFVNIFDTYSDRFD